MRRRIPSLTALQCFDASARHLSFTKAAEELALTQSAISRQIKKLEAFLACPLFERVKQRLQLTEVGLAYAKDIREVLDRAETATLRITLGQSTPLRVGAEPAIAGRWLIPKLGAFRESNPDIEIDLVTDMGLLYGDGNSRGYDIAILYGEGQWSGLNSQLLMEDELVAVAAPKLLAGHKPASEYGGILNWPLLHHSGVLSSSLAWLRHAGLSAVEVERLPGQRLENFQLLLQAAIQGMGVAILPKYFIAEELLEGRLLQACEQLMVCPQSYYVAIPQEMGEQAAVRRVADWLILQAEERAETL